MLIEIRRDLQGDRITNRRNFWIGGSLEEVMGEALLALGRIWRVEDDIVLQLAVGRV